MAWTDALSRGARGAVAQVNPFDQSRTWETTQMGVNPGYRQAATPSSTPSYQPSSTARADTSALDKQLADSNSALKALQAQIASQPRLPFYDTSAAWARAQKGAENAVNPVYVDKLNAYLNKARVKRQQTEEQTNINKQNIQTGLQQSLEDIGVQRKRTGEDAATSTADTVASEAFDQEQGGTAFDRARTALLGEISNAGLTSSGIGRQIESQAVNDRNLQEGEATRQYEGKRKAIDTLKNRTFEDLSTSETRSKGEAEGKTKQQDIDLRNFIDNAGLEEGEFRTQNEAERLSAVSGEVNNQYKVGAAQFIQSLIGSGARAQDIALAQQVYA